MLVEIIKSFNNRTPLLLMRNLGNDVSTQWAVTHLFSFSRQQTNCERSTRIRSREHASLESKAQLGSPRWPELVFSCLFRFSFLIKFACFN